MKTLEEIKTTLKEFEKAFGIPVVDSQQGSEVWFKLKLGVLSASNISKAVAKVGSETRNTYMAELAAQVCTGLMPEISSKYMDWGNDHEDAARSSYEFATGLTVKELPFVYKDSSFREGCSPDGFVNTKKGVEIKCPWDTTHYIKFLTQDKIKPEYKKQCQYTLRVTGADEWDFVQYDPRMKISPLKILKIERDLKVQAEFDELIPAFIYDLDQMLEKIGVSFGDQWKR